MKLIIMRQFTLMAMTPLLQILLGILSMIAHYLKPKLSWIAITLWRGKPIHTNGISIQIL